MVDVTNKYYDGFYHQVYSQGYEEGKFYFKV